MPPHLLPRESIMDDIYQTSLQWIEANKADRPFAAGALAYVIGERRYYGCHFGLRSTLEWAKYQFGRGWDQAERDSR